MRVLGLGQWVRAMLVAGSNQQGKPRLLALLLAACSGCTHAVPATAPTVQIWMLPPEVDDNDLVCIFSKADPGMKACAPFIVVKHAITDLRVEP